MKALRIFILGLSGFVSLPGHAKPIEEMPELRQVGHLTEIAAAMFVDLKLIELGHPRSRRSEKTMLSRDTS